MIVIPERSLDVRTKKIVIVDDMVQFLSAWV